MKYSLGIKSSNTRTSENQIGIVEDEEEKDNTTAGDKLRNGKARHQQLPPTAKGGLSYDSIWANHITWSSYLKIAIQWMTVLIRMRGRTNKKTDNDRFIKYFLDYLHI